MVRDASDFFWSYSTYDGIFLFAGSALFPVIPGILEAALSAPMRDWNLHYVGDFTAPLMVATLYGWRRIHDWMSHSFERGKSTFVVLLKCSLALALCHWEFSLPGAYALANDQYAFRKCMDNLTSVVPADAPLAVENWIVENSATGFGCNPLTALTFESRRKHVGRLFDKNRSLF